MLEASGVTKSFGGLTAIDDVSLEVEEGQILGLIGPNGAGKTTLFNVISGVMEPDGGTIIHRGKDITGLPPHMISRHGITRTFQISRTLYSMTVLDNMLLMAQNHPGEKLTNALLRTDGAVEADREYREKAHELLETVELSEKVDSYARELSGGQQKLLEIGRALMTDPDVILMDEPLAGVAPQLAPRILEEIETVSETRETAFVVIEHDLKAIRQVSDKMVVLANGSVIATGDPDEVSTDDTVVELYVKGRQAQ